MAYINPKDVNSPKASWKLIEILRSDGDGGAALALGEWQSERVLALRWNGSSTEQKGVGNPQSRGLATWFVLPQWMNEAVLTSAVIPDEKRRLAAALM